jgi:VanZ family protein
LVRTVSRFIGLSLATAIVILTVVPAPLRPTTHLPHVLEHALIFLLTGMALAVGYTGRELELCVGTAAFCAAIEVCQLFIPGRHARLVDFVADVIAALAGIGMAFVLSRADLLLNTMRDASVQPTGVRARLQAMSEKLLYAGVARSQLEHGPGGKPENRIRSDAENTANIVTDEQSGPDAG